MSFMSAQWQILLIQGIWWMEVKKCRNYFSSSKDLFYLRLVHLSFKTYLWYNSKKTCIFSRSVKIAFWASVRFNLTFQIVNCIFVFFFGSKLICLQSKLFARYWRSDYFVLILFALHLLCEKLFGTVSIH